MIYSRDPPSLLGDSSPSKSCVQISVSCSHLATPAPSSWDDSLHPKPDSHPQSTHKTCICFIITTNFIQLRSKYEKARCSPALCRRCRPFSDRTARDCDDDGGCSEDDGGGEDGCPSPALRLRFPAGWRACGRVVCRAGWSGLRVSWRGREGRGWRLRRWGPAGAGGRWAACGARAGCWKNVCRAPDPSQTCGVKTGGCCCDDTRTTDWRQKHEQETDEPNQTALTENSDSYLKRQRETRLLSIYPPIHLSICPSIHPSIYLFLSIHILLFI